MSFLTVTTRVFLTGMALSLAGGCVSDPGAPLIPLAQRQATVLPTEVPERDPDGFANVLADPATVAGLPRTTAAIDAEERNLEAEAAQAEAATAGIRTTGSAAALAARGRNHVADTRAAIMASARPRDDTEPAREVPQSAAVPPAPADPGTPIDPDAPLPRAVGVPPFTGGPVAPPSQRP